MVKFDPYTGHACDEEVGTLDNDAEILRKELLAKNMAFNDPKYPLLTEQCKRNPRCIHAKHKKLDLVKRFDLTKSVHYLRELMSLRWRVATPEEAEKHLQSEKAFTDELRIKTERQLELEQIRVQTQAIDMLARTMQSLPQKEEPKKGK